MMGAALIVVVLTSNLIGVIIGVAMAAVGVYFLIRPPSPEFYVEPTEDTLIISRLTTAKIPFHEVRSAELWRPEYPTLLRGFLNFFSALGNLFGGRNEMIEPDAPPKDVIVRFRSWVWVFFVVPPLLIPRRN